MSLHSCLKNSILLIFLSSKFFFKNKVLQIFYSTFLIYFCTYNHLFLFVPLRTPCIPCQHISVFTYLISSWDYRPFYVSRQDIAGSIKYSEIKRGGEKHVNQSQSERKSQLATPISFLYHMSAIKMIIPKFDSFVIACIAQ